MIIKENKKEKIKRESICYSQILIMVIATFAFAYLVSAPEIKPVKADTISTSIVTSCCEKTTSGAWCQNAPSSECASGFQSTPTSCDSTSYCKLGCCYDSQEGLCMENTPQNICSQSNGTWADSSSCSIPQCNLGCCVLNGQAAFVTLARCKKLSSFYSISTDFRNTITSETSCIALASLEDRGACVYDVDYSKTCKFTTRNDCNGIDSKRTVGNLTLTSNVTFYKDTLCSSESLATNCGPSEKTTCSEGFVYFLDTCNNIANIYDASRIKDKVYWDKKIPVNDSCVLNPSLSNSASCGSCDYLQGSRCGSYQLGGTRPSYGDNICRDLNCKINGVEYNHGESWCSTDVFNDSVGSRYFRHICADGEEIIEPCMDFRNQVCTQDKITTPSGNFLQGACTINRWQDCTSQDAKDDCLNTDKRDCKWVSSADEAANSTLSCLPLDPPGFKFWTDESENICNQASSTCVITYEKGLLTGKKCTSNCQCESASWKDTQEAKCESLGDCGLKINYVGVQGKAKTTAPGKQTASTTSTGNFNNPSATNFTNPSTLFLPLVYLGNIIFSEVGLVIGDTGAMAEYQASQGGAFNQDLSPPPSSTNIPLASARAAAAANAGGAQVQMNEFGQVTGEETGGPDAPAAKQGISQYIPGVEAGSTTAVIIDGLGWAIFVAGMVRMLGGFLGMDTGITNALSNAVFTGMMASTLAKAFEWGHAGAIGIGVGILVFVLTYKEESTKIVTFECNSFEAPIGGRDCEKCNNDALGCTEYRCKALGQACQLLDAGTKDAKCAWVNPKDVTSPIITPWKDVLTKNHVYVPDNAVRPPAIGIIIQNNEATDKKLKAFSPITFGITTDEPSQCKIDYNHTSKFEDMKYFMDSSSVYAYNHSETLNLPSPDHLNSLEPTLKNDGKYNLFIRCKDANGNYNVDEFAVSFSVESGPDATAPIIEETNPINNAPVQYELSSIPVTVYTNEPSDCKWSRVDQDYDNMEYNMLCSNNQPCTTNNNQIYLQDSRGFYKYTANLTGLQDGKPNVYYFKCKDQPNLGNSSDRNKNVESYVYTLRGSQPLDIIHVSPNATTVSSSSNVVPVDLEIETSNGESNKGDASCYFSQSSNSNFVKMFTTGTNIHNQRQDLVSGDYTYYFRCVDLGGNSANSSTSFSVYVDNEAPKVVRAYKDSTSLKIITDENSSCSYSVNSDKKCDFLISEGVNMPKANTTEHYTDWKEGATYYIKCADTSGNVPVNTICSISVSMTSK